MNNNNKSIINELIRIKKIIWETNNIDELVYVINEIIFLVENEIPSQIELPDNSLVSNDKGKLLILDILKNDLLLVSENHYSNLTNSKIAISSTLPLIIGLYTKIRF